MPGPMLPIKPPTPRPTGNTWTDAVRNHVLDALGNPANEVMLQPWMAAGKVIGFPRLARPLTAEQKTEDVGRLAEKVRQLSRKLGQPFGDRDGWAEYLDSADQDLDLGTLREMWSDLQSLRPRTK
jgi:hypothetical protein